MAKNTALKCVLTHFSVRGWMSLPAALTLLLRPEESAALAEGWDGASTLPPAPWLERCRVAGLLGDVEGVRWALCGPNDAAAALLEPLVASPLTRYAALPPQLRARLVRHVLVVLRGGAAHLVPLLEDRGARRDYLALAAPVLLDRVVSQHDAATLVGVLVATWRVHGTAAALDEVSALLAANLCAVWLLHSVAGPAGWEALVARLARDHVALGPGLAALSTLCASEVAARTCVMGAVGALGFQGAAAALSCAAWTGQLPALPGPPGPPPDHHRHAVLRRSGQHMLAGEQLEWEESERCEFKAVQNSREPVAAMLRMLPTYVTAFLNAEGGRILFGVEDDGRVAGLALNREERDQLRLGLDTMGVVPDPGALVRLALHPVVGAAQERFVVQVEVAPGGHTVYATRKYVLLCVWACSLWLTGPRQRRALAAAPGRGDVAQGRVAVPLCGAQDGVSGPPTMRAASR